MCVYPHRPDSLSFLNPSGSSIRRSRRSYKACIYKDVLQTLLLSNISYPKRINSGHDDLKPATKRNVRKLGHGQVVSFVM